MGDGRKLAPDEFAAWYSPALTLGLLDTVNFENVANAVHLALVSGDLTAAAATLTFEGASLHLTCLPSSIWVTWPPQADHRFWATGNLLRPIAGRDAAINAYGVRFDPAELARLFPRLSVRPQVAADPAGSAAKGGRPAGKNGEPIALVTARLLRLSAGELTAYTAEAAAAELIEQYRALGLQPPSPDNARRDAAGILRAVRN